MKKTLITIITIVMMTQLISAATWNTHSTPTGSDLETVKSLSGGEAFTERGGGAEFFKYESGSWASVGTPNSTLISGFTYNQMEKTSNGNIYLSYQDDNAGPTDNVRILTYNFDEQQFENVSEISDIRVTTSTEDTGRFVCIEKENECYISTYTDAGVQFLLYQMIPSVILMANTTDSRGRGLITSEEEIMGHDIGNNYDIGQFNGATYPSITSSTFGSSTGLSIPIKHLYKTSSQRVLCSRETTGETRQGLNWYNSTAVDFPSSYRLDRDVDDCTYIDDEVHYITNFGLGAGGQLNSISYGGLILETTRVNLTTNEFNSIDYDETTGLGWAVGESGIIYQFNNSATIVSNTTTNVTNYDLQRYTYQNDNITNINAIAPKGSSLGFAIAENNGDLQIMSVGSVNVNNLVTSFKNVTGTFIDPLYSIAISNDKLYLGTNNELYLYNGTNSGNAGNLTLENTIPASGFDIITDVAKVDDNFAWVCRNQDDLNLYNRTSNDLTEPIVVSSCESIEYDDTNDLLIVHRGTDGIDIYDQTSQALLSTISVSSQPIQATQDRISIFGNTLFAITYTDRIEKYDISTPSSPSLVNDCRNSEGEILSVESYDDQTAIIGGTNNIRVCDFENTALYEAGSDFYFPITLEGYLNGEKPLEIGSLNTNGKIHLAEQKSYSVALFTKTYNEEDNNDPPGITNITVNDETPCINQTVFLNIIAVDPEGDPLTYDYHCDGGSVGDSAFLTNEFTCNYETFGNKTINVQAKDDTNAATTSSLILEVGNCTATPQFNFEVLDSITGQPIEDVSITVSGVGSTSTDASGLATIDVPTQTNYLVTITKTGYTTVANNIAPSVNRIVAFLDSLTGTTALTVNTEETNTTRIPGSLVSVTNTITGENRFGITDALGTVTFTEMFTGNKLLLSATNQELGFEVTGTYVNLQQGEQEIVTLTMSLESVSGVFEGTGRGCDEFFEGVWLCGDLSINGTTNTCSDDTDCISDRCSPMNTCSKFNYTLCDEQGLGRGNMCVIQHTTFSFFDTVAGTILKYFLFTIIAVILLMGVVLLILKRR